MTRQSVWNSLAAPATIAACLIPVALAISKFGGTTWQLIRNLFM